MENKEYKNKEYKNKEYKNREQYISGSAAPEIEESPRRVQKRKEGMSAEEVRRIKQCHYARENQRRAGKYGIFYALGIVAAVFITMKTCVDYITVINNKISNTKRISDLTTELKDKKEKNDQRELDINSSINYDYIYKTATEELGMVHAGDNQIIKYQSGESEYVIQYKDILPN